MDTKTFFEELSRRLDISKETVSLMTGSLAETMGKSISELESLSVPNFGIFEPRLRQERIAVHPANGKRLLVPPRMYLVFKNSPTLKQKLNNGK